MNLKAFKENMAVYGSDVNNWPKGIKEAGLRALKSSSEIRSLSAYEARFESLLTKRKYEAPSPDLGQRISAAVVYREEKSQHASRGFFSGLLAQFGLPRPALTAVALAFIFALVIGFAAGFSTTSESLSAEQYQANLEDFLYYEGEVL